VDEEASVRLHAVDTAIRMSAMKNVIGSRGLIIYNWHTKITAASFTANG